MIKLKHISSQDHGYISLNHIDFLEETSEKIEDKVKNLLKKLKITTQFDNIYLLTTPNVGFKTFNPASFYLCFKENILHTALVEVTNTYGEKHLYVLSPLENGTTYKVDKNFHVSPFFEESGYYEFTFDVTTTKIKIGITYKKNSARLFYADINGNLYPLTKPKYLLTLLKYPLTAILTFPRIVTQALILYYIKKISAKSKPRATSEMTIRPQPLNFFDKICKKILVSFLKKCTVGSLHLIMPDGSIEKFGDPHSRHISKITIINQWFFRRVVLSGEIGLGEAFVEGYWESESLENVVEFFILNRHVFNSSIDGKWIHPILNWCTHKKNHNSLTKSKDNIAAHYDLSNSMYDLFLDPLKVYSSGIYKTPTSTLEDAQEEKMNRIIQKANLKSTDNVLEIGSGWGALAIKIAQDIGCHVTTITLSQDQFNEVSKKIKILKLEEKVTILLQDFRIIEGQFSKIVSVEMLEAVGHQYLEIFFKKLDQLLTPNGTAVLQVISFPDFGYNIYKNSSDFIRKHIFPGGHLPSLSTLCKNMADHTDLIIDNVENIGHHYAPTLAHWREKFLKNSTQIKELGFDEEFIRKFHYYFSFCEAAFRIRFLMNYQLVLSHVCITEDTSC